MANCRKFKFYQQAKTFAVECAKAAHGFPEYEKYALASQLRRAAYSAVLNIAEGMSRSSLVDRRRLLEIARSSLHEAQIILELSEDLGYLDHKQREKLQPIGDETGRTLFGYMQSVTETIDAVERLKKQKAAASATALALLVVASALSHILQLLNFSSSQATV